MSELTEWARRSDNTLPPPPPSPEPDGDHWFFPDADMPAIPELRRAVHPRLRVNWAAVITCIGALLVGFVIGCSVVFSIMAPALTVPGLPPCVTEDSTGCYWDAETMGNGQGVDVVDLGVPACTNEIADAGGICHGEPLRPTDTIEWVGE